MRRAQRPVLKNMTRIDDLKLRDLQPSQFYISAKKLQGVEAWLDAGDLSGFEPIPVKVLDGVPVMTDGHTRAVAALRAGLDAAPLVWDEDELDWEMYRICVEACRSRQLFSPVDLMERIIPETEYAEKWDAWCDKMQAEVKQSRFSAAKKAYVKDPCAASSLPFWKTEQMQLPANLSVYREDQFNEAACAGTDTPYFRMIHTMKSIPEPVLPAEYELTSANADELASHVQACYDSEGVTCAELHTYTQRPVYDAELWIAVRERKTGRIAASGIGELDGRIGEGVLEWIQTSPAHRRRGLGKFVVCELLRRLSKKADFVTVSGRMNNPHKPYALYRTCGFSHPVIWHVVRQVEIRRASGEEMLALWGYPDLDTAPPTAKFFFENIVSGNAVFWTVDRDGELLGELYAFLNIREDPEFADGTTTAYLCAFRIKQEYRGQGLGSKLMQAACADLKSMGFRRATIGVNDPRNKALYRRLGFDTDVKTCYVDPCARDENMQPEPDDVGFLLLAKRII